jgi:hypothetical protein
MALITDAELLAMSFAEEALSGIDSTVRTTHRELASARVRTYVVKRYPAAEADLAGIYELKDAAASLAAFSLLSRRGVDARNQTWPIVERRWAAAEAWLVALVNGDVELADLEPTKGAPMVATSGDPQWTNATFNGGGRRTSGCCS